MRTLSSSSAQWLCAKAKNAADFIRLVKERTGIEIRVLSGEEEADLLLQGGSYGSTGGSLCFGRPLTPEWQHRICRRALHGVVIIAQKSLNIESHQTYRGLLENAAYSNRL